MPTSVATAPPPKDPHAPIALTSRPQSAAPGGVARRQWNAPPAELFPPPEPRKPSLRRPMSAAKTARPATSSSARASETEQRPDPVSRKASAGRAAAAVVVSPVTSGRRLSGAPQQQQSRADAAAEDGKSSARRLSAVAEVQLDAISRGSPKRLSQVTWARLQKANDEQAAQEPLYERSDRKKHLTVDQQLEVAVASRRDAVRSANVKRTLKRRDVEADNVRPLIEIAYWSPFLEVRRDAAAALASLSRNPANLDLLSEVGTLGALISMLSAGESKTDPAIAYDCAQTLVSMAKLDAVKLKVLQAPEGLECVFGLLHSHDARLRCAAFELVRNLVTVEELRQAVAKREGFAYMLDSCTSKDSRIRLLAATILHELAESSENRFLFYHSSHFETLANILHDPFIERDVHFRKGLLGFIHLLVAEEENGRKFVELHLVPTLLLILDSPKATHQICVLVVSILESVAACRKNHQALVDANALPRIVHLCFCSPRGLPSTVEKRPSVLPPPRRPQTAGGHGSGRESATRVSMADLAQLLPMMSTTKTPEPAPALTMASLQQTPVVISSEVNALLRPAFTVFCEMAKNPVNREHIIRSKLVDYITARNLYAASDKRVRRSVITLLTFLICRERERDRRATTPTPESAATDATKQANPAEAEFKHYIELLARGVIKCLFGILCGNDFSMKVDAIAAIAQLTEDANSRITMCKPQLLRSLQEFAFHPLIQTRTNIARIIANFAERPENILKLIDEGMLSILVKYVCPISRNNDVLVEATRAIAAMSMVHVARNKLVESGVLGTLLQFCKSPSTSAEVHANATVAIRNLRHDAAALCIQSIYRGWCVRVHHARTITTRKRRIRKMTSLRKIQTDQAFVAVMERFTGGAS